jgi:hypothetical protein
LQEATSSDPDENDSALERSYSPTPEREEAKDERLSLGLSSSIAKSRKSLMNFFSSRTSLVNEGKTNQLKHSNRTRDNYSLWTHWQKMETMTM